MQREGHRPRTYAALGALLVALLALAAVVGATATRSAAAPAAADSAAIACGNRVSIGFAAPVTGPAGPLGQQMLRWGKFAESRWNRAHKLDIRLIQGDTQLPDTAQAVLETATADGCVLNLGSGVARRIADIARTLADLTGRPDLTPQVTGQFRNGDVRHCTADITRARRTIGFEPRVSWEDGLAELIAWSRQIPATDHFAKAHDELGRRGLLSGRLAVATKAG